MNRRTQFVISITALFLVCVGASNQDVSTAQLRSSNEMPAGSLDKGITLTGYLSRSNVNGPRWSVFIGPNGKVYKLFLTDKKVSDLYIDGQRIADSEIAKHTAAYQGFLERLWQRHEIEREVESLHLQMQPAHRRIEILEKEMSKLDEAEERLEKAGTKRSANEDERRAINAQQVKLGEMIRTREAEIEPLSKREEVLDKKQESLGLDQESDKVLRQISEDLRSLGVITSLTGLSFKLSNLELIVNGKKPSPAVFEKLKAKYIFDIGTESGFLYNWKWKE